MSMTVKLRKIGNSLGVIAEGSRRANASVGGRYTAHYSRCGRGTADSLRSTFRCRHEGFRANAKEVSQCIEGFGEVGRASHTDEDAGLDSAASGGGDTA